jgi:hypothetical protein
MHACLAYTIRPALDNSDTSWCYLDIAAVHHGLQVAQRHGVLRGSSPHLRSVAEVEKNRHNVCMVGRTVPAVLAATWYQARRAPVESYDTRARPLIRPKGRPACAWTETTIGARATSGVEHWGCTQSYICVSPAHLKQGVPEVFGLAAQ